MEIQSLETRESATVRNWQDATLQENAPIFEAIRLIDSLGSRIVLVTDSDRHLLGTVTDGDIRRGILKGISLDSAVKSIMNKKPVTVGEADTSKKIQRLMRQKSIQHIPILDKTGRIVRVESLEEIEGQVLKSNEVIVMAGGLGTRLRPLTEECPKPMLSVGGKPILETILENLSETGFQKFHIAIHYKGEMIQDHFGDGSRLGINIDYIRENEKLGTAGALTLLPTRPQAPFIVINGDVLTNVNFDTLLEFHRKAGAVATMAVRGYDFQVPYGVVRLDGEKIAAIDEKPIQKFLVNAGIYVLDPAILDYLPHGEACDMPALFTRLVARGLKTSAFPIREYWMDIGRMSDFDQANDDYAGVFKSDS